MLTSRRLCFLCMSFLALFAVYELQAAALPYFPTTTGITIDQVNAQNVQSIDSEDLRNLVANIMIEVVQLKETAEQCDFSQRRIMIPIYGLATAVAVPFGLKLGAFASEVSMQLFGPGFLTIWAGSLLGVYYAQKIYCPKIISILLRGFFEKRILELGRVHAGVVDRADILERKLVIIVGELEQRRKAECMRLEALRAATQE